MKMSSKKRGALVVFGSGPGIGLNVAGLFAANAFNQVFLVSRDPTRLQSDKATVLALSGRTDLSVQTVRADISNDQSLTTALKEIESSATPIGTIFFNAARIEPSPLLSYSLDEMELDFRLTNIALLRIVRWAHPLLAANIGSLIRPSVLVTNSFLYKDPRAALFSLTSVKAAQRSLVWCLNIEYAASGVHYGLISVGGPVAEDQPTRNPKNIAQQTWKFYNNSLHNELEVEIA